MIGRYRRIGNLSIVVGYFILLNVDPLLVSSFITAHWYYLGASEQRCDFVALVTFLMTIGCQTHHALFYDLFHTVLAVAILVGLFDGIDQEFTRRLN